MASSRTSAPPPVPPPPVPPPPQGGMYGYYGYGRVFACFATLSLQQSSPLPLTPFQTLFLPVPLLLKIDLYFFLLQRCS